MVRRDGPVTHARVVCLPQTPAAMTFDSRYRELRACFMSSESDNSVELRLVSQRHVCPVCGGPTSPHEETIIRLGHTDEVRYRHRCVDTWCGGSLPLPETVRK